MLKLCKVEEKKNRRGRTGLQQQKPLANEALPPSSIPRARSAMLGSRLAGEAIIDDIVTGRPALSRPSMSDGYQTSPRHPRVFVKQSTNFEKTPVIRYIRRMGRARALKQWGVSKQESPCKVRGKHVKPTFVVRTFSSTLSLRTIGSSAIAFLAASSPGGTGAHRSLKLLGSSLSGSYRRCQQCICGIVIRQSNVN